MRITPIEIRQKTFEKKLRGYDKDEVEAFLTSLSNEWERVVDENKEQKIKLEHAEKEVRKLREVESSLFKTLKTAEDTGANLVDQANKAAELHLRETEMNAQAVLSESKSKAKAIIEGAEQQAKQLIVEMQDAIKDLEQNYKTIESQRDSQIGELNNLLDDIKERLGRTTKQHHQFKVEDHLIKVRNLVRESEASIDKEKLSVKVIKSEEIPVVEADPEGKQRLAEYIQSKKEKKDESPKKETEVVAEQAKESSQEEEDTDELSGKGSFFDQVGG